MLEGLRTVVYQVADLDAAKAWYAQMLGKPPYFDQPFYVGFNVGGYELGLQPSTIPDADQARESVTYWGVPDAEAAYARLRALGAKEYQPMQEVGDGIKLGAVLDPQGNVVGVIQNPHFVAAHPGPGHDESEPGLTFSAHIPQGALEQAQDGAHSAGVSLAEYIGECALDGIYRGYR